MVEAPKSKDDAVETYLLPLFTTPSLPELNGKIEEVEEERRIKEEGECGEGGGEAEAEGETRRG